MLLKLCLSVVDNARDAVLLHVSAASERQERKIATRAITKKTEHHILIHSNVCVSSVLCFYTVEHLAVQVQ